MAARMGHVLLFHKDGSQGSNQHSTPVAKTLNFFFNLEGMLNEEKMYSQMQKAMPIAIRSQPGAMRTPLAWPVSETQAHHEDLETVAQS